MSSGQKAWEIDNEEQACADHRARLSAIPIGVLANIIDDIYYNLMQLEASVSSLPRSGWFYLDTVREQVKRLK